MLKSWLRRSKHTTKYSVVNNFVFESHTVTVRHEKRDGWWEILGYINDHTLAHGYAPTRKEAFEEYKTVNQ